MKKLVSVLLALVMALSCLTTAAFAAEHEENAASAPIAAEEAAYNPRKSSYPLMAAPTFIGSFGKELIQTFGEFGSGLIKSGKNVDEALSENKTLGAVYDAAGIAGKAVVYAVSPINYIASNGVLFAAVGSIGAAAIVIMVPVIAVLQPIMVAEYVALNWYEASKDEKILKDWDASEYEGMSTEELMDSINEIGAKGINVAKANQQSVETADNASDETAENAETPAAEETEEVAAE